jgi:hypothetical protein
MSKRPFSDVMALLEPEPRARSVDVQSYGGPVVIDVALK